jgi:hypothetical protein
MTRRSAQDYDLGRIGNRVQNPCGCAAVTTDESSSDATAQPHCEISGELIRFLTLVLGGKAEEVG